MSGFGKYAGNRRARIQDIRQEQSQDEASDVVTRLPDFLGGTQKDTPKLHQPSQPSRPSHTDVSASVRITPAADVVPKVRPLKPTAPTLPTDLLDPLPLSEPVAVPQKAEAQPAPKDQTSTGKISISMSKTSLIAVIFGLMLLSILCFVAGIFTAQYINAPAGSGKISLSDLPNAPKLPSVPDVSLPTGADFKNGVQSGIAGALGTAPKLSRSGGQFDTKAIAGAVRSMTPEFAAPAIERVIPKDELDPEFIDSAKRMPTDADAGRFTAQAKVYAEGSKAMQLAKRLKAEGYAAYIVRHSEPDNPRVYYHVRAGSFGGYITANTLVRRMREMGSRSATVVLISQNEERLLP